STPPTFSSSVYCHSISQTDVQAYYYITISGNSQDKSCLQLCNALLGAFQKISTFIICSVLFTCRQQ
ncbi:hypothetical protein T4A_8015, partial [Trichinella pseudospiralis]